MCYFSSSITTFKNKEAGVIYSTSSLQQRLWTSFLRSLSMLILQYRGLQATINLLRLRTKEKLKIQKRDLYEKKIKRDVIKIEKKTKKKRRKKVEI